jgi:hypothetical protein
VTLLTCSGASASQGQRLAGGVACRRTPNFPSFSLAGCFASSDTPGLLILPFSPRATLPGSLSFCSAAPWLAVDGLYGPSYDSSALRDCSLA